MIEVLKSRFFWVFWNVNICDGFSFYYILCLGVRLGEVLMHGLVINVIIQC